MKKNILLILSIPCFIIALIASTNTYPITYNEMIISGTSNIIEFILLFNYYIKYENIRQ